MTHSPLNSLAQAAEAYYDELRQFVRRRTGSNAIDHLLSTVTRMDRILYMDSGQIKEAGSHSELLQRDGGYAAMWQKQAETSGDAVVSL